MEEGHNAGDNHGPLDRGGRGQTRPRARDGRADAGAPPGADFTAARIDGKIAGHADARPPVSAWAFHPNREVCALSEAGREAVASAAETNRATPAITWLAAELSRGSSVCNLWRHSRHLPLK